MINSFPF